MGSGSSPAARGACSTLKEPSSSGSLTMIAYYYYYVNVHEDVHVHVDGNEGSMGTCAEPTPIPPGACYYA